MIKAFASNSKTFVKDLYVARYLFFDYGDIYEQLYHDKFFVVIAKYYLTSMCFRSVSISCFYFKKLMLPSLYLLSSANCRIAFQSIYLTLISIRLTLYITLICRLASVSGFILYPDKFSLVGNYISDLPYNYRPHTRSQTSLIIINQRPVLWMVHQARH